MEAGVSNISRSNIFKIYFLLEKKRKCKNMVMIQNNYGNIFYPEKLPHLIGFFFFLRLNNLTLLARVNHNILYRNETNCRHYQKTEGLEGLGEILEIV